MTATLGVTTPELTATIDVATAGIATLGGATLGVARVAAGLNILLLLVLVGIWGRNYLEIRSKHTLGSAVFALFLLAENALALFYYLNPPQMSTPALRAMMYLQILEFVGIAFLVYVTWD
ncbi:hypothetical protein C470_06618 [Halorubrum distributum JCM 13561]|uniref:Uncharacterized protein n=2 Tax=Halorubrum distributum TaxID=29283 RepID=M0NV63_9EURY|nr:MULTISPECIES: hypothetical protein [Halorubrum distributum group]EMA61691.1 hypothetical protein C470_06618 [Halorubrum litoreum JCM 13561]EMA71353.1 hypothetical protein C462_07317 [Halorubrum arcis JCM 13916]PHQ45094.1 hypothetical protein DJ68_14845 [Halorubrum sp. C3]